MSQQCQSQFRIVLWNLKTLQWSCILKQPDSVADVWKNVLVNMSDFKELVPEFYDTETAGDFLENSYGIDFGYRHDGTKVDNVHLPPWAKGT